MFCIETTEVKRYLRSSEEYWRYLTHKYKVEKDILSFSTKKGDKVIIPLTNIKSIKKI